MLNMMDQFMRISVLSATRGITVSFFSGVTEKALYFRIAMPASGKEDVKVSVEQNTLTINGEFSEDSKDKGIFLKHFFSVKETATFGIRIRLPEKICKTDQIKTEVKKGVLEVLVPIS